MGVPATATRRSHELPASKNGARVSCAHAEAAASSSFVGGSPARNRSVIRRQPILKECDARTATSGTRSPAEPLARPNTISVEPPPISANNKSSLRKSFDAPKNDSAASRSPGITESSTPTSRRRDTNTSALRASRLALVASATTRSTAQSAAHASITLRYSATWATVRSIASGKSSPDASTPSPKFVMALWRATCRVPEASTSATSKRLVTVPISIAAILMRRTFPLALPSCLHCKERAGEIPRLESCFIERRYIQK